MEGGYDLSRDWGWGVGGKRLIKAQNDSRRVTQGRGASV